MTKLSKQNVAGTDYAMVGCALTGVCTSVPNEYTKVVTLSDGDTINDGMLIACTFTYSNTAGNAPGTQTIYSSDQENYFSDAGLTIPFTLAPSGCYTIEYTGMTNMYTYQSYPVISAGGVTAPVATADGKIASGALWPAGSIVRLLYTSGKFCVQPYNSGSVFITASSTIINSTPIVAGSVVKIMFTLPVTGSDTTAALRITYNGSGHSVKVGKDGSLADLVAHDIGGTYTYLQAYTTLELAYDGTQFIIIGNPVVISNSDYTVYADGSSTQQIQALIKNTDTSIGRALRFFGTENGTNKYANNLGRLEIGYGGWCYVANPRMDKQFPVDNDSPYNVYIAIQGIFDIFCDYETCKVYMRCKYDYGSGWHALW